jgi:peptidyl-prolyl cis-trans isomerase-like 1
MATNISLETSMVSLYRSSKTLCAGTHLEASLRKTQDGRGIQEVKEEHRRRLTTNATTQGTLTLELYGDHAPRTCNNFRTLCGRGYYDGTVFHRVIPGFMVQGGDPTGTGRGGSSIYGERFADEISPSLRHTGAGVLSMANAGPDTNGSQFFLTLAPTPWLDGRHTIFGRVKSGLSVLKRMGLVKTAAEDRPVEDLKILRARVLEEGGDE